MVEVVGVEEEVEVEEEGVVSATPPSSTTTAKGSEEEEERQRQLVLVMPLLLWETHTCETREASRVLLLLLFLPRWMPRSRKRNCDIERIEIESDILLKN